MNNLKIILFAAAGILFLACGSKAAQTESDNPASLKTESVTDEREIRDLIRQALKWGVPDKLSEEWQNIRNRFDVVREDGKWKISYLETFGYGKA
ncbi:MAG: hypothetical protein LBR34_03780 [Prevotella sp.]|nr:hypothetical protein [Prevotella sp.]